LFDADFIGGNRELGKVLANGFLKAAASLDGMQGCVILISNAVRLAAEGSYALEVLSQLSSRGVRILLCGTCVDFFGIRDKLRIGTVSNALEIMATMAQASKVIKF
jgi:peroxiredoxin family protein